MKTSLFVIGTNDLGYWDDNKYNGWKFYLWAEWNFLVITKQFAFDGYINISYFKTDEDFEVN